MITRRDLAVAFATAVVTVGVSAAAAPRQRADATPSASPGPISTANSPAAIPHSTVFNWSDFKTTTNEFGSQRAIVRGPTPTLDELEMHFTTLLPGKNSHDPHRHFNEELVIMKEGELETLSNGVWKKVGPGSVIYNASCELHGVRNVSNAPVSYHVVNWSSPGNLNRTCPQDAPARGAAK